MVYVEDDYLMLSGIQHFQFCKRQWALIHIDQQWVDNEAMAHGQILHTRADNPYIKEKRKDFFLSRAMHISSACLGLYGIMDVVEFHKDDSGVMVKGKRGRWLPRVVEYKRGRPKKDRRDIVQLVAQTMCLEETLNCQIAEGSLYYHSVNKKVQIAITDELRREVQELANQMHRFYGAKELPKAEYFKNCQLCSLVEVCKPRISKKVRNVDRYIAAAMVSEEII
ncbi:TPA: CRISPR-associated protein Cas4 [Streptococcus equi subsp. zooepidemicus]|nr:CRISPR-associated protein Cas4 [Streptococcus equi subsp. zooepidemicus]